MIRCSRTLRALGLLLVMVWLTGWSLFEPSAQELCDRLIVAGEVQDEVLSELLREPRRAKKLMVLFGGWGRRGQEYDNIVIHRVLGDPDHFDGDLLNALKARLREDPTLLCQIAEVHVREHQRVREFVKDAPALPASYYSGNNPFGNDRTKTNSPWVMDCLYDSIFRLAPETDEMKISALLCLAIDFGRPELILNLTMANLNEQWAREKEWLCENARYVYFDEESGVYALDEDAARRKQPVAPERQQPREKTGGARGKGSPITAPVSTPDSGELPAD